MALRPTTSKARAWLVSRGEVARATTPATRSGNRVPQSRRHVPAQRTAHYRPQPLDPK